MKFHTEFFFSLLDSVLSAEKSRSKTDSVEVMKILAEALGNPQNSYKIIHITGSKGKGSVATMSGEILWQMGKKVGVFTSPHISNFFQRITLGNGDFFPDEIYESAAEELLSVTDCDLKTFSWFELVTAFALLCFRQAHCEFAILEVGMGGRLDATNIVESDLSIITNIELEHKEFLGDRIEKIAWEKAGIIKPNGLAFSANQQSEAEKVIRERAKDQNATLIFVKDEIENPRWENSMDGLNLSFELSGESYQIPMKAGGGRQCEDALLATLALKKYFGSNLEKSTVTKGLAAWKLSGRFEIRHFPSPNGEVEIILDGAHTEESLLDLTKTLHHYRKTKFILLFSCAKDKNPEDLCEILAHNSSPEGIFLTRPGNFKKCDFPAMGRAFSKKFPHTPLFAKEDFTATIVAAIDLAAKANLPLVVTGSFYLVAEVSRVIHSVK